MRDLKKRLIFHAAHFGLFCALVLLAVFLYCLLPAGAAQGVDRRFISYILGRRWNLAVLVMLAYPLFYVTGFIEYTLQKKGRPVMIYFLGMFKLVLILGMVSFLEFYLFYPEIIGRWIYFWLFCGYALIYFLYIAHQLRKGWRKRIWLIDIIPEQFRFMLGNEDTPYHIELYSGEKVSREERAKLVYRKQDVTSSLAEFLIRQRLHGWEVLEIVDFVEEEYGKILLDSVDQSWFLDRIMNVSINYLRLSRMVNLAAASLLVIVLFPPGFLMAMVHRLFSPGPIFYSQDRVGLYGNTVRIFKFRTMHRDAEKSGARFVEPNDQRVTPVGRFLRRFRLDEIPQLLNVLSGDLNLVGPRPERREFVGLLSEYIPFYRMRLMVKPGLTGWAQVNGDYAGKRMSDHRKKFEFDLYYLKNRSLWLDLFILMKTAKIVLRARGR